MKHVVILRIRRDGQCNVSTNQNRQTPIELIRSST